MKNEVENLETQIKNLHRSFEKENQQSGAEFFLTIKRNNQTHFMGVVKPNTLLDIRTHITNKLTKKDVS